MQNPFDNFPDELLLEIGKIALLRGNFNFRLQRLADHLLATRLGDQGIAAMLTHGATTSILGSHLSNLGRICGVSSKAISSLDQLMAEHRADFERAEKMIFRAWTYLGGPDDAPSFGSFNGDIVKGNNLTPDWDLVTAASLRGLTERLKSAHHILDDVDNLYSQVTRMHGTDPASDKF